MLPGIPGAFPVPLAPFSEGICSVLSSQISCCRCCPYRDSLSTVMTRRGMDFLLFQPEWMSNVI